MNAPTKTTPSNLNYLIPAGKYQAVLLKVFPHRISSGKKMRLIFEIPSLSSPEYRAVAGINLPLWGIRSLARLKAWLADEYESIANVCGDDRIKAFRKLLGLPVDIIVQVYRDPLGRGKGVREIKEVCPAGRFTEAKSAPQADDRWMLPVVQRVVPPKQAKVSSDRDVGRIKHEFLLIQQAFKMGLLRM